MKSMMKIQYRFTAPMPEIYPSQDSQYYAEHLKQISPHDVIREAARSDGSFNVYRAAIGANLAKTSKRVLSYLSAS